MYIYICIGEYTVLIKYSKLSIISKYDSLQMDHFIIIYA